MQKYLLPLLCDLRTVGNLKVALLLSQTAAFTGATLCGIIHLHGLTPRVYLACVKL
jgi:hypothetical protein